MKVLNLDGLTYYNANLLDKVENMIDDSIGDCINDISVNESSIMFSKKDGTSENISLTIGDADTVDGIHADGLQKVMIPLDNNTNVLEYAENYPVTQFNGTFFTYRVFNGYNEPYSDSAIGSGDYYYYANKLDEKWITLIAVDVRSSNMFMRTRNDGTWGLWRNISNEGIANTAKRAHNAVFTIPNNGTSDVEGGELQLTNQDGTVWNIDSNSNNFRIFDSNGKVHLHLYRDGTDTFIGNAATATTATNSDTLDGYHASSFPKLEYKSNTNWDTLVDSGMYRLDNVETQTNYINGMTSYGQLLVIRGAGDTIAQIYFNYADNGIFSRSANGVGGTVNWTAWHRLYTSQNMTYGTNSLTPGSSSLANGHFYFQYE